MDVLEKHKLNEQTWKAIVEPLTHHQRCTFAFMVMGAIECHMDPQEFRRIIEGAKKNAPWLFPAQTEARQA